MIIIDCGNSDADVGSSDSDNGADGCKEDDNSCVFVMVFSIRIMIMLMIDLPCL